MGSRKITLAANWKMNKCFDEVQEYMLSIPLDLETECDVIIGCPSVYLQYVSHFVKEKGLKISIAAQNCSSYDKGAYTGEISASMIRSVGASHVILGHSERRSYFNEDDQLISKKIQRAHDSGLNVIWCCGEVLDERKEGKAREVIQNQFDISLGSIDNLDWSKIIIAYEPVWAIGTGEVATPEMAEEMHNYIRSLIPSSYSESVSILYGGSMKPGNATELLAQPNVDGGLVGGASLVTESFIKLVEIGNKSA